MFQILNAINTYSLIAFSFVADSSTVKKWMMKYIADCFLIDFHWTFSYVTDSSTVNIRTIKHVADCLLIDNQLLTERLIMLLILQLLTYEHLNMLPINCSTLEACEIEMYWTFRYDRRPMSDKEQNKNGLDRLCRKCSCFTRESH